MAERNGQLQTALQHYHAAEKAWKDRTALINAGLLRREDVDNLSWRLIERAIQGLERKIKTGDHKWEGDTPEKNAGFNKRRTINRLSPTDEWADIRDAGESEFQ